MLGIAADLQHALAELGERDREVRRGRALADAALAVDREHLGGADLQRSGPAATWTLPSPSRARVGSEPWLHRDRSCGHRRRRCLRGGLRVPRRPRRSASSIAASGVQYLRSCASIRRFATLAEAVGFSAASRSRISGSSTKVCGELLVDPGRDLAGRRRPADGVGDVRLDLAHALVAVLEHALVPFRIEHAGAGLQRHLLGERAHRAFAAGLVADIDRRAAPPLARSHRAADAAQRVEIMVDGGDAELDRSRGSGRRDRRSASTLFSSAVCCTGLPVAAVGEALAARDRSRPARPRRPSGRSRPAG